jgi:predicted Zn-dependent protease
VKPLQNPDKLYLRAAEGWLELGNPIEAKAELDQIRPPLRVHPDALELRWEIHAKTKEWNDAADIGRALTQVIPGRSSAWIKLAYALHELQRTKDAWDTLMPAAAKFPREPTIPYNLACYACQMGQLTEARDLLAQALKLGNAKELKAQAMKDPDLAPLWADDESA